jgi:hypothetical protein
VLVQVAFAIVALGAVTGLVVDYGVLWVARAQAQNVADSAALSGATTLAFDTTVDTTMAQGAALAAAGLNQVWSEPAVAGAGDVLFPACLDAVFGLPIPPPAFFPCVTVNVRRNAASGAPLPTFFMQLVGVTSQGVQASASARVLPANTTDCLRPLAIPDKWTEFFPFPAAWTAASVFQRYTINPPPLPPTLLPLPDLYLPPTAGGTGTGFAFVSASATYAEKGRSLTLTPADLATPTISAGQFVPVTAGGGFAAAMGGCNNVARTIGQTLPVDTTATAQMAIDGAAGLIAADSGASWNATALRITGSCTATNPPCAARSPRLIAIPVFNPTAYVDSIVAGVPPVIQVTNIVGFFITGTSAGGITGVLTGYPGRVVPGSPAVNFQSAFLREAVLYR